jgi:hypothetical protein
VYYDSNVINMLLEEKHGAGIAQWYSAGLRWLDDRRFEFP